MILTLSDHSAMILSAIFPIKTYHSLRPPSRQATLPERACPSYNATSMATTRASLHTLGCRLNQAETSVLGEGLRRKGFELVDFGQPTDLLVLNTCAVTEDAERTARYLIRKP